jgi:hypothetical protein
MAYLYGDHWDSTPKRSWSQSQVKYSTFGRELYACNTGIGHFWFIREGTKFTIFTDHKPLAHPGLEPYIRSVDCMPV